MNADDQNCAQFTASYGRHPSSASSLGEGWHAKDSGQPACLIDMTPGMDAILDTVAAELRSQYSVGYYPNRPVKDRKWHSVRIRMKNPDYSGRVRKEYLDK